MARGGRREGAGRPKGALNLKTRALLESVAAGGEMPIGYIMRVMRDENAPSKRRDKMALAAAAYFHPRLLSVPLNEDEESEGESTASDGEPENGEVVNSGAANGGVSE